jgi:RNA polymerase primary sigma factor
VNPPGCSPRVEEVLAVLAKREHPAAGVKLTDLAGLLPEGLTVEETSALIEALEQRGIKVTGQPLPPAATPAPRGRADHPLLTREEEVALAREIRSGQQRRLALALRWPLTARNIRRRADQVRSGVCRVWDVLADYEGTHPDEDEDQAEQEIEAVGAELGQLLAALRAQRARLERQETRRRRAARGGRARSARAADGQGGPAQEVAATQARITEVLARLDYREGYLDSIFKEILRLAGSVEAAHKQLLALERKHGLPPGSLRAPDGPAPGWERALRGWGVPAAQAAELKARVKAQQRALRLAQRKAGLGLPELGALAGELRQASRQTDLARQTLVEANQRLVIGIARRYPHHHMDFVDLVQEGNLGLMRAADRFDPDLGFRFGTYAAWWVRQSIGRLLAEQGSAVRIPPHVQESLQKLNRITRRLVLRTGREPSLEELATQLDKTPERIKEILSAGRRPVSTDAHVGDDDDSATLLDFLPDPHAGPDEEADLRVQQAVLQDAMGALSPREREIIAQRFQEGLTLQEVGERFGITRERTRQLQEQALRKLRKRLKADTLRRLLKDERSQRECAERDADEGRAPAPRRRARRVR